MLHRYPRPYNDPGTVYASPLHRLCVDGLRVTDHLCDHLFGPLWGREQAVSWSCLLFHFGGANANDHEICLLSMDVLSVECQNLYLCAILQ